jgi:hypothetical protein
MEMLRWGGRRSRSRVYAGLRVTGWPRRRTVLLVVEGWRRDSCEDVSDSLLALQYSRGSGDQGIRGSGNQGIRESGKADGSCPYGVLPFELSRCQYSQLGGYGAALHGKTDANEVRLAALGLWHAVNGVNIAARPGPPMRHQARHSTRRTVRSTVS